MLNKKEILRMDILSRKSFKKSEMYRLVMLDGTLTFDKEMNLPGKGIYIHMDEETIKKVFAKKMLRRYTSSTETLQRLESEMMDAFRSTNKEA